MANIVDFYVTKGARRFSHLYRVGRRCLGKKRKRKINRRVRRERGRLDKEGRYDEGVNIRLVTERDF